MDITDFKFHEITLQDQEWMTEKFKEDNRNACEYTFANNFIWRKIYQVEVGERYGCAVIRFWESGERMYSYPIGNGDKKRVIEELRELAHQDGHALMMGPLSEADRFDMLEWFPGEFRIQGNRDDFDYIYSREKLTTLAGKKLHGKRNHIARFKDEDDWSYEELTDENQEECRTMTYSWIKMREEKWNDEMEKEMSVLHEAFDHRKELGLVGGLIRKAGEIVAFSIGEPLNEDTFVVHFEKAFPDMQGAYPMINQQFVLHATEGYDYVNREEDTGDLGLRKAKLSYYPEILLKKYNATESNVVFADKERNKEQIKKIWQTCFGDEEDFVDLYMERQMTDENMLVLYQDGNPVSMASFLPVAYEKNGEQTAAKYVYAVATLPEYRKRGYAAKIIQEAKQIFNVPLILVPANASLQEYYEKIGFCKAFGEAYEKTIDVALSETETNQFTLEEVSAEEYNKLRNHKMKKNGYVYWDEPAISYAIELANYCGGKTLEVIWANESTREEQEAEKEKDILMYMLEGDKLIIIETTLEEEKLPLVISEIERETGKKQVINKKENVMVLLSEQEKEEISILKEGYFNLTLG